MAYKVIALSVGVMNNIYKSGDSLTAAQAGGADNADRLVKEGFLKKTKLSKEEKAAAAAAAAAAKEAEEVAAAAAKEAEEVAAAAAKDADEAAAAGGGE